MTIGRKVKSGFFWLTSGAILQSISKIVTISILSRLLPADAFGVITVATAVIGLAELLVQLNLSKALIQLPEISQAHVKVAFTFSMVTGVALMVLFVLVVNPVIASFFNYSNLTDILNVLSVLFPIHSFSQLSFCLLQRNKDFKSIAGLEAVAYLIGYGGVAVVLSWFGFGVWSLAYGSIAVGVLYAGLLFWKAKFTLKFGFDKTAFDDLFRYGMIYSLIRIVNYGALKGDYFVIGKVLGATKLGIYSRAYALMDSVNSILGKVLYTLLMPFTTEHETTHDERKYMVLKILSIMFNLILPLSVLAFAFSDLVIHILLGNNWGEAVIIFKILSVSMIARVGYKVTSSFLLDNKNIVNNFLMQSIYCILIVSGTYFGSFYFGLVGGTFAVSVVLYVVFAGFVFLMIRSNPQIAFLDFIRSGRYGILLSLFVIVTTVTGQGVAHVVTDGFWSGMAVVLVIELLGLVFVLRNSKTFLDPSLVSIVKEIRKIKYLNKLI